MIFNSEAIPAWESNSIDINSNINTSEGVMAAAGLDWEVEKRAVYSKNSDYTEDIIVPDKFAIIQKKIVGDFMEERALGIVGNVYKSLQNSQAFQFFDSVVQSGDATYETAGSSYDDKIVWILVKMGDPSSVVPGDDITPYILLSNSHDGRSCVRMTITPIRLLCANTLAVAENICTADSQISVRHTPSMLEKLTNISNYAGAVRGRFSTAMNTYRTLARKQVTTKELKTYFDMVFPSNSKDDVHSRTATIREQAQDVFETGRGMAETDNTLYKAYNSVNEMFQYNSDKQDSMWFGSYAKKNQRALNIAIGMI